MFDRNALRGVHGIYAIIRRETGKLYIGSSGDVGRRFGQHLSLLRRGAHTNYKLQRAWLKYGEGAFLCVLLERVPDRIDLRAREQWWLDRYQPYKRERGYNRADTVHQAGWLLTQAQCGNLSKATKGKPKSDAARAAMSAAWEFTAGRQASASRVGKLTAGRVQPPEVRARLAEGQQARRLKDPKFTPEQKSAIKRRLLAGERPVDLSSEFGIDLPTLTDIRYGRIWRYVEPVAMVTQRVTHSSAKLSPESVALIKRRLLDGEKNNALAVEYGVTASLISNIRTGKAWSYIDPAPAAHPLFTFGLPGVPGGGDTA